LAQQVHPLARDRLDRSPAPLRELLRKVEDERWDVLAPLAQIHTFEAQLATLKAKAESAKADAELEAIANLATTKLTLDQKVRDLKKAGEGAFQQAKADIEARIAEFEKSVKAVESKIKAWPLKRVLCAVDLSDAPVGLLQYAQASCTGTAAGSRCFTSFRRTRIARGIPQTACSRQGRWD
jgi:hypothetical protein